MDKEQQRIAIAEWCGWKLSETVDRVGNRFYERGDQWRRVGDFPKTHEPIPDYLNDLNAMHEAEEKILTGDGWKERLSKYSSKLMSVMHDTDFGRIDVVFKNDMVHLRYFTLHATAAQRAEALLRTIGKWSTTTHQMKV